MVLFRIRAHVALGTGCGFTIIVLKFIRIATAITNLYKDILHVLFPVSASSLTSSKDSVEHKRMNLQYALLKFE
jgi:hypothetical protein